MATKYGVQATKHLNQAIPQLHSQGTDKGNIKSMYDSYALTADLASGDIIKMGGSLPEGARVVQVICKFDDLDAAGGTIDIGWAAGASALEVADPNGFTSAAIDVTTAGIYLMTTAGTAPGYQKTFADHCQIQIVTVGDTDATSGSISLEVQFVID